jgi:lipopolysaccharide/colanic/teichoic acid biosynthesis glycosyltransferase
MDYVLKRVFPKFSLTKKIYFFLTRGQNRVLTRAETLGRLYSCGFEVVGEANVNNIFFFAVKKTGIPAFDKHPSYGPLIKLRRVGRTGKIIKVYKLRTMHPFAEYLQDYIYQKHSLEEGGKFKNDFRVSSTGKLFRKLWIDELPMLYNLLRGDLKLVGVRPLSLQYFNLYSQELKERRIQYRPGLVPPYYAHMPKTLEEIMASEMKYLDEYEKHPFLTDFRYFWKAMFNILIKRKRSR